MASINFLDSVRGTGRKQIALTASNINLYNATLPSKDVDSVKTPPKVFTFDAVLKEDHSFESEATVLPVEDGSNISDHIKLLPKKISIEGIVSETQLSITNAIVGNAASSLNYIPGIAGRLAATGAGIIGNNLINGSSSRMNVAYEDLFSFWKNKTLFVVTTSYNVQAFKNMVITSLKMPRDPKTGNAIKIIINLSEIIIAKSQQIDLSNPQTDVKGAIKQKTLGTVEGLKDKTSKINSTVTRQLFNKLLG